MIRPRLWLVSCAVLLGMAGCQLALSLDDYKADRLVPNGESCTKASDCRSGQCAKETGTGRLLCYGQSSGSEPCTSATDCTDGTCEPTSNAPGAPKQCVSWTTCDTDDPNTSDPALAICKQFQQSSCSEPGNLSDCFNAHCEFLVKYSTTERQTIRDGVIRSDDCCLPAGKGICGIAPQCGCPAKQTCIALAEDGATKCVDVGPAEINEACANDHACGMGHDCVGGLCKKQCVMGSTAYRCPVGSQCTPALRAADGSSVPGAFYCRQSCSLVDPSAAGTFSACVSTATCHWVVDHADCVSIDPALAAGTQGASCDTGEGKSNPGLCARGHFCDESSLKCVQYCQLSGKATACTVGVCMPFKPVRSIAGVEFGSCVE